MPRREGGQPPIIAHTAPCPAHPERLIQFKRYWDFKGQRHARSAMGYCGLCNKETPESSTWAYQPIGQTIKRVNKLVTHTCTTCGSEFRKQSKTKSTKCARCKYVPKKIKRHMECVEPDCTDLASERTHHAPWVPRCTWHWNDVRARSKTELGNYRRAAKRDKERQSDRWRRGNYKKTRAQALERDNNQCVWCGHDGTTHRLEVDHIQEEWYAPELSHELSNLQTMCYTCHAYKSTAVRAAMYELAKENQLHFELLVDKHTALARTERAQAH